MELNLNLFQIIGIIFSSGLVTSLGTVVFETYIRKRKEHKYEMELQSTIERHQVELEKLQSEHQKELELEKLKLQYSMEIELEKTKSENQIKIEKQRIQLQYKIEQMQNELSKRNDQNLTTIYKRLTEVIYRIRNSFRDIIDTWKLNEDIINENKCHIDQLVSSLFENRFELERSGVFKKIHNLKNISITLHQLLIELNSSIVNKTNNIEQIKRNIAENFSQIDDDFNLIVKHLTSDYFKDELLTND